MKKFIQKKLKNQRGMTLIELLAVIVIIAIIAAIAIPAIGNIIQNSREDALVSDAQNVLAAANVYFAENGSESTFTHENANLTDYLESIGEITSFTVTKASPNTIDFTGTAGNLTFQGEDETAAILSENGRDALAEVAPAAGDGN
ncbi:prepilin-type N-terminal cleavage/methylation domain-containing protein [Planomicrobium sp. CPCC 101110]|uniref:prepilin-type N-terminal cleavage/methylation domain-containing protein n=1 Tax=Planomicrobium sp. CPCC 101110 TaxID=2599619 RepID=UPI0011B45724|nr:prepilin-type N-terminal cleavage/methylation domain-containing protein [Planomicrobium sp. CPCC 101110]TWT26269.1 prepilin-type N-terminal cleavage/methylation domain-containing protein [Planomicrobium sp. CPCC 101110]